MSAECIPVFLKAKAYQFMSYSAKCMYGRFFSLSLSSFPKYRAKWGFSYYVAESHMPRSLHSKTETLLSGEKIRMDVTQTIQRNIKVTVNDPLPLLGAYSKEAVISQ